MIPKKKYSTVFHKNLNLKISTIGAKGIRAKKGVTKKAIGAVVIVTGKSDGCCSKS